MTFYDYLIKMYFENINPPTHYSKLCSIGGPISWYMADSQNSVVNSIGNNNNYILDIDISHAFPTICECLYPNTEFVKNIRTHTDKKSKNIYIATTLKGEPLQQINRICKMVILGIIFDTDNEDELNGIDVFELKKDGCIITCNKSTVDRLTNLQYLNSTFTKFIVDSGFEFHSDYYSKYIRCNRTSFLLGSSLDIKDFIIKGNYKYVPIKLLEIMFNIILKNEYDQLLINKIYSKQFFKIIQQNNLQEYLKNYYLVNNKIINYEGKYSQFNLKTNVCPDLYKKIFIHPMILSNVSY